MLLFPVRQVAVPVVNFQKFFPVRRIYCIGQNYLAHQVEMGNTDRKPPFFFQKPADAIVFGDLSGQIQLPYAPETTDFQYECEMVVAIGSNASETGTQNISSAEAARDLIFGYAVGLDMTRRDLQAQAKKAGRPWDLGKGFSASAPISSILHRSNVSSNVQKGRGKITLKKKSSGESEFQVMQSGDLSEMIWSVEEQIMLLSRFDPLFPGDLIFTGTPSGVGPVKVGDQLVGEVEGIGSISVEIIHPTFPAKL